MTSAKIRQSFLDFFKSKQHAVVPSSSLLPDAPNLLFTNAGMNQFVPIFLGQAKPQWNPPRTADTQKCIRAGGKHNDLEDVGLDTYHHTFFEMLGNWSFGDPDADDGIGAGYFKREAIDWAWELLVNVWHFPKERLYATYFGGDDKTPEDKEAKEHWLRYLPAERVLPFGRKDNFWMMGDTGPCGPCSEIHVDLTPRGDGGANLVNAGKPECIEIWNLVFVQFNANADPDNSLSGLPAKHVDTGMGFERVCGIIQCTNGLKDFSRRISNYESDVFAPIFRKLGELSGKQYGSTLPRDSSAGVPPVSDREGMNDTAGTAALLDQIKTDIAFRVIADHIRCLSFAIADGILPSNEGRGYVLRRILRRAVRYGRNLGFHEPFFYKLVNVVADNFGAVFPEVRRNKAKVENALRGEEEAFNRTLDRGLEYFDLYAKGALHFVKTTPGAEPVFDGQWAFTLYDTYGFPIDLTELLARERGMTVDKVGFEVHMDMQRRLSRADYEKKKAVVAVVDEGLKVQPTKFVGYENLESEAVVETVVPAGKPDEYELVLNQTPFYAEMGGQVGDTGLVHVPGHEWTELGRLQVLDTQRQGDVHVHRAKLADGRAPELGEAVRVAVDAARRGNIQRHHTATHLFHWALQEVVNRDARQRGSLVAPDRMRFDFNHPERLTEQQIADIERLVNEHIKEDAPVSWTDVAYTEIKNHPRIRQFFGEKYGDIVRVVQVGGHPGRLDGFSMELCGGTHVRNTGDIGLFKIARESAVAAGIRRVEAVCGQFAREYIEKTRSQEQAEAEKEKARERQKEEERRAKSEGQKRAVELVDQILAKTQRREGVSLVVDEIKEANAELLRAVVDALKSKLQSGVVVLGGVSEGKVSLICHVTPDLVKQGKHAGKIVGELAKICGGGGGGRPDLAQAGGKQPEKLAEALAAVGRIVGL
jgi:alanyl-tRNA synthetase